jgi:hypothetical protein
MRELMVRHQIQLEEISPSYQLEAEIVSVNDKIIYLTGLLKTKRDAQFFSSV